MRSIAACVAVLALLGGCAPSPGTTFEASASPGARATAGPTGRAPSNPPPSASDPATSPPTGQPTPPGSPDVASRPKLRPDRLATVLANNLDVRMEAGSSAPLQADYVTVKLDAADHVLVLGDPAWADGSWWVEVGSDDGCIGSPTECTVEPLDGLAGRVVVGWVDAGTSSAPSLDTDPSWCPDSTTLGTILELSPIERLGCFGSTSIAFTAYAARLPDGGGLGGACDAPARYPRWLICDNINYNWVNRDGSTAWELKLHFDPRTGIEPTGLVENGPSERLRIFGHFDDAAAMKCDPVRPTGAADDSERGELHCRTLFAVEAVG